MRALLVPPSGTLPALDVLRTAAIVLVIANHVAVEGARLLPAGAWGGPLFGFGWTGVDLFFVLSGFLIGRQLHRELARSGTVDVPRFLLRRGFRIWPLYFAWVAFVALALGKWRGIGPDLVFLSNYRQGQVSGGWSLSTEEQFYLVVPLLLLLVQRTLGPRAQGAVPLVLLAAMPVVRAVVLAGAGSLGTAATYTPIHTHCDGLLAGLFLAWLSVARPGLLAPGTPVPPALRVAPLLAIAIGLALRSVSGPLFGFTGLALVYGAVTVVALRAGPGLRRLCAWRPFHVLSRLSFGMYLLHFEVLPRIGPALVHGLVPLLGTGPLLSAVLFLLAVLASAAAASVTFVLVEDPFLALRDRWERRRRPVPAPGAVPVAP